jgi:hypothetical protein
LLPTAACQLSLFTTAYIAMRVFLQCNNIALPSGAPCAYLFQLRPSDGPQEIS